ncbi:hypothetical protein [Parapedobacter sp. 10938]|uniref:hypothetical protein n=1 Tax=Parapedobacter flavus TaxID=3110225 RepID=UPI002DB89735|nr:hypothetical protein [Parapedobacter sp. 10938]MEC3882083.1 hypothetical protein [Parapedobacter sp. 10938]
MIRSFAATLLIGFNFLPMGLFAQTTDIFSVGFNANYTNESAFGGELFLKRGITLFQQQTEIKAGIGNRSYSFAFDGVQDLQAASVGLFGDLAIYPFNQDGFFVGVRLEPINLNWLAMESMSRFENDKGYRPSSLYSGACAFFQAGYRLRVSDRFRVRLYGQPGVQQFRISNGETTFGDYIDGDSTEGLISESQYKFIYNVNLGVEIRLK